MSAWSKSLDHRSAAKERMGQPDLGARRWCLRENQPLRTSNTLPKTFNSDQHFVQCELFSKLVV
eukprot:51669-Amphidinium_carterae.1